MSEIILDSVIDSIKLLPFLFLTYLFMEWLEHKTGAAARKRIRTAGKFGPVWGVSVYFRWNVSNHDLQCSSCSYNCENPDLQSGDRNTFRPGAGVCLHTYSEETGTWCGYSWNLWRRTLPLWTWSYFFSSISHIKSFCIHFLDFSCFKYWICISW